jgi:hypothetical protein
LVYYRRYQGSMSKDVDRMLAATQAVFAKHPALPGHRVRHWLARARAAKAIRYGILKDNLWPHWCWLCRRGRRLAAVRNLAHHLLRHPLLLESLVLHGLTSLLPARRRSPTLTTR